MTIVIEVVSKMGENTIYIGRPSPLGNPFPMAKESQRQSVCDQYDVWFQQQVADEMTRDNETGLIIYDNVFYDAKTGTGIAAMKVPTRFPATGEDGVMRFDVSASPWLAYKSNEPTMLTLEASLRMIKNGEKKCVIERSDGEPFSIHGSFLPMLTRTFTKGKRTEGLNSQLKSTVRYQLSGAALKSVTIDMSHAQPLQTMTVVLA